MLPVENCELHFHRERKNRFYENGKSCAQVKENEWEISSYKLPHLPRFFRKGGKTFSISTLTFIRDSTSGWNLCTCGAGEVHVWELNRRGEGIFRGFLEDLMTVDEFSEKQWRFGGNCRGDSGKILNSGECFGFLMGFCGKLESFLTVFVRLNGLSASFPLSNLN
jgi:hypothetical protein